MLYSSILTFYLVIFVIVIIPKCVTWDFGDISNRIHALCKLRCDYHLVSTFPTTKRIHTIVSTIIYTIRIYGPFLTIKR